MKVAIDARYIGTTATEVLPDGGIGRYVYRLLLELLDCDPEIRFLLIVPASNGRDIIQGEHAARVREVRMTAPPHSLRTLATMARSVDFGDADLLHAPANVLPFGLRLPAVTTIHDTMWLDDPKLCASFFLKRWVTGSYYRAGIGRAAHHSREILTVSQAAANAIVARFPDLDGRVTVTHHGVDPFFEPVEVAAAEADTEHIVPRGVPFVLCVGQGSPYKNHAKALTAFAEAFRGDREMKIVFVRRFTRRDAEMATLLDREDLRGRVIALPAVKDVELRALYARARIFLFPSVCEGFGMPLLEAMAYGTPVLTANFGAMAEVAADAALTVDTHSLSAIARGLRDLDRDGALRADLSQRGLARVQAFSFRAGAEKTRATYERALRPGEGSSA